VCRKALLATQSLTHPPLLLLVLHVGRSWWSRPASAVSNTRTMRSKPAHANTGGVRVLLE
jgi:hypothetical protein